MRYSFVGWRPTQGGWLPSYARVRNLMPKLFTDPEAIAAALEQLGGQVAEIEKQIAELAASKTLTEPIVLPDLNLESERRLQMKRLADKLLTLAKNNMLMKPSDFHAFMGGVVQGFFADGVWG